MPGLFTLNAVIAPVTTLTAVTSTVSPYPLPLPAVLDVGKFNAGRVRPAYAVPPVVSNAALITVDANKSIVLCG